VSYWALNVIFLAVVAAVGVVAIVRTRRRARWPAVLLTLGILLVFTAVFDNVMIGVGLVGYDVGLIAGAFVGIAPLEDFAYAIAAAVLLPSLWMLLPARPRASGLASTPTPRETP
jgi:lycopene cyclase domain-containing protein